MALFSAKRSGWPASRAGLMQANLFRSLPTAGLALLFFVSGACALVYQVLWLRLLGLVFGVTIHAATTVLASFMGGLAIGSFVAGRLSDRVGAPLRWFGIAELAIAATALLTPWLLQGLEAVY